ncbi:MAG: hypothetical protein H7Z42_09890, partial [Roseiflexaceae bacterium]|nr:hypothetical protein [Roseiflexaceae bacterium]
MVRLRHLSMVATLAVLVALFAACGTPTTTTPPGATGAPAAASATTTD